MRDFTDAHPDFQKNIGDDPGLVQDDLGADSLPVYEPVGATAMTAGTGGTGAAGQRISRQFLT